MNILAIAINEILKTHSEAPLRTSDYRCVCGYWSGVEVAGKTRPVGVVRASDWHHAQEIAKIINPVLDKVREAMK